MLEGAVRTCGPWHAGLMHAACLPGDKAGPCTVLLLP